MAGRLGLDPLFQQPEDDEDFETFFQKTLESQKNEYVSPKERKDYFDQIGLGQLDGDADLKLELYEAPRSRIEQVLKERQANNNQNLAKPPEPSLFSSPVIDLNLAKRGFKSTAIGKMLMGEDAQPAPAPQDDPLALTPLGPSPSPAPGAYTRTTPGAPPDLSKELNDMRQVFKETAKPPTPQVKTKMIGTPPEEKAQESSFLDKAMSYLPFGGFLQSDKADTEAPETDFAQARTEAESRYPFLKKFRSVAIAPSKVKNKGGLGEFVGPDDETNPNPGQHTITIGENSSGLQGGVADTIVADMVHAAADLDPQFQALKQKLRGSLSDGEIEFARQRYENDFKGKYSGSNFETFDNFLSNFWLDGTVQHLLLPENSEIEEFKRANPNAVPVLGEIEKLFKTDPETQPSQGMSAFEYASPLAAFTTTIMDDTKRNEFIDTLKQAGSSVMQGLAQVPSGLFKSIGIAAKAIDDQLPAWLQQHGEQKTEEMATYQIGQSIQEAAQQAFPTDPDRQHEFVATVLPQAIGSMLGFMATGGAASALGGSRLAGTVMFGAGAQAPGGYEEAKAAGPQPDTETPYSIADVLSPLGAAAKHLGESSADQERNARKSFLLGLGIGATEAIPIERAIARIDAASGGGLSKVLKAHGAAGAEEWVQEFFQTSAGNAVAQQLYDQDRNILEGTFENAAAGGVAGFMMSVVQGMLRLKGAGSGYEPMNQPIATNEGVPSPDPTTSALPSDTVASEGTSSPLAPEDLTIPDVVELPSASESIGEGLPPVDLPVTENNLGAFEGQQVAPEVQGPPQAEALQEEGPITEEQILSALGASFPQEAQPKLIKQPRAEEVINEVPVPEPPTVEPSKPLGKRAQAQADQEAKTQLAGLYDTFRYADAMDDQETMQQVAEQLQAQGKDLPDPEAFEQWADVRDTLNAAKNSLGVAGKERGFQARVEVAGQGGTPEIAASKSPTDQWFKDLTSNPAASKHLVDGQKSWNKEKIDRTIEEGLRLLPGEAPSANLQVLLDAIQSDPKYSQLLVAEPDAEYAHRGLFDEETQGDIFHQEELTPDEPVKAEASPEPKAEVGQPEPPQKKQLWEMTALEYAQSKVPGATKPGHMKDQHRVEVKAAINRGESVPANVLAEYPDLQPTPPPQKETNKPTPYSFQEESDDFALTPLAAAPKPQPKAKAEPQPELFGTGETLEAGVSPIIGREVTPEEAPLFSKTAQEEPPEQSLMPFNEHKPEPQAKAQPSDVERLKPGQRVRYFDASAKAMKSGTVKTVGQRYLNVTPDDGSTAYSLPVTQLDALMSDGKLEIDRGEAEAPKVEAAEIKEEPVDLTPIPTKKAQPETKATPVALTPLPSAPMAADLPSHEEFVKRLYDGEVSPDELKQSYAVIRNNKDAILAQLKKETKAQLAKRIGGMRSMASESKESLVRQAYTSMLSDYSISDGVQYNPMEKDGYEKAIDRIVEQTTPEKIAEMAKKVAQHREDRRKRIEGFKDPQTLEDFDLRVRVKGEESLSPEQLVKYDELLALAGRERKAKEQERKATIQGVNAGTGMRLTETVHTRDQYPIFVVQMGERVDGDTYQSLNQAAHKLGGRYSSYSKGGAIPGFTFKSKQAAEQFMAAAKGETVSAQPAMEEKKEARQQGAVEHLREVAERMDEKASETLNADRKTNTARRASMASSIEARAEGEKAIAQSMRNLADVIESGEATHLDGLRTKAQVEMLDRMVVQAKYERDRKRFDSYAEQERHKGRHAEVEDVAFAKFPDFRIGKPNLQHVINDLNGRPGTDRLRERFKKLVANPGDEEVDVSREDVELAISKYPVSRTTVPPWHWTENLASIKRMESMGITNIHELRAALREFIQYRGKKAEANKVKQLERELIGQKGVGIDFFPTPKPLASRMVDDAGIEPGMKVLEPSAGNGNIAEAIRAAGVNPDVVEMSSALREILEAKDFNLVGRDFMDMQDGGYDRIIMNPPFSNGQDGEHVQHAYELLKPGGKIVAIMGEGSFFRSDKKAEVFREWLEANGGESESLPANTFKDASLLATTGANARLVTIEKPSEAQEESGTIFEKEQPYGTRIPAEEGRDRPVQRGASATEEPVGARTPPGRPEPRSRVSPLREGGGVRTIGKRLTQELTRVGKLDLRGATVRNTQELAELAQIYRNPQYETLRVWYVKDGKVVGHEGLTSRLPNVVSFAKNSATIQNYIDRIAKLKKRFKADGYYLQHNHPSGDPTASREDKNMTALLADQVLGMQGHVIINHGKYAVLTAKDAVGLPGTPPGTEILEKMHPIDNKNFRADPHKAHPFLGANATDYQMIAEMGKRLQAPKGYTTVLYRGAQGRVEAIQEVPDNMVRSEDFAGYIRNSTRDFGAVSAFTYSTSPDADLELRTMELVEQGVLRDALTDGDEGLKLATEFVRPVTGKKNLSQGVSTEKAFQRTQKVMEDDAEYTGKPDQPSADAFADLERQDKQIERKEVKAGSQPPAGQPPRGIPPKPAFDGFDVPSESTWERIRRYVQDRFRRLAVVQDAITEQIGPIEESKDAYLHTELFPGKVEPQIVELEREHFRPLIKAMREAEVSKEQLDQFLYAKHAPERNAHVASINDKMPDGGSGMSNAKANQVLADFTAKGLTPKLESLAKRVYAINQKRLDTLVDGGLITAGERQVLNDTYEFYVPLKGAPGEQAPSRPRIGKGFDIRGKENKRALGRKSEAHSILEHVWAQSDEAIIRAEKNLVGQAFLEMATQYPHKEMWTVNPVKFRRYFDQRTGEVKAGKDPLTKLADNVLSVKVNGKEHYIEIHDEALAQAMKNLGAERSGMVLKALQGVNRYLAMVNTALNPEFVLSNFQRDIQTAGVNLAGEQGLKFVRKVMMGVPGAVRGSYGYIANQDTSNEWGKWFKEYEETGGRIGFFGLEDIEVKRGRLQKLIERLDNSPKAKAMGLASGLHDLIFDLNGAIENGVRLSAYKQARIELGMSPKKAASLARNLTVDFNKKGILGNVLNGMYLFFNANLQGTARLAKALTNKRVQKIVGGAVAGAFLHAELNRWLAGIDPDDDENYFAKLEDYIQESFIPFFYGAEDGSFAKWQLPYGYNTFYWFGQALNRLAHGDITPGEFLGGFARTLLGAFNPLGSDDMLLKNAVPTFARWWVDLELNRNFFGGPIMPEQFPFAAPKPDSELYFRSVSESSKVLAQNMNRLTGGSQWRPGWADVSPETIDYMVQYFTGGTGATILRSGSLPVKLIKGVEIESNEVPLVRKFLGNPSLWKTSERWREEADDVETALRQKKDLKETDPAKALGFEVAERPLLRLERHMKVAEKALSYLSDLSEKATTMEDEAEVEAIREASARVQKWFHRHYRQAKEGEIVPALPYDKKHNNYKIQGERLAKRMRILSARPAASDATKQQPPQQPIGQQSKAQFNGRQTHEDDPFLAMVGGMS